MITYSAMWIGVEGDANSAEKLIRFHCNEDCGWLNGTLPSIADKKPIAKTTPEQSTYMNGLKAGQRKEKQREAKMMIGSIAHENERTGSASMTKERELFGRRGIKLGERLGKGAFGEGEALEAEV